MVYNLSSCRAYIYKCFANKKIEFSLSDKYLKKQEDQLAEEESRSFQLGTLTNGHWKYSVTRFHTICMNQITIYFFLGGFSQFSNCSESAQIQLSERWLFHFRLIEVSHLSTLCANNQCWACDKIFVSRQATKSEGYRGSDKTTKNNKNNNKPYIHVHGQALLTNLFVTKALSANNKSICYLVTL